MVTIIIPSKTEKYLDNTIRDIQQNATGEIEIIVALDGYDTEKIEGVKYFQVEGSGENRKRYGINQGVAMSRGEYVMWCDAHCLFKKGFDEQLVKDSQPNLVQIPRRHRLDAENWCLQPQGDDRPPIDYEYFMFAPLARGEGLHGYKWDSRTIERADIMIDDTLEFQGSCVFMTKDWFNKMGFMDLRYSGWGSEAEEIGLTTWKNGGRVVTNKNTFYAHLHKGKKYGRMYHLNQREREQSWAYARNLWLNENKDFFISLIKKFWPLPSWPSDWKERIWTS